MEDRPVRVLHTVDAFLPVTENWIYSMVTAVPGAVGAVLCGEARNLAQFPMPADSMFARRKTVPAPGEGLGSIRRTGARLANRIREVVAPIQASHWKPDLIHAHFGTSGLASLRLQQKLGVPLLTSFYGYDAWLLPDQNSEWRLRLKTLFAAGDLFLAEGPAMKARLVDLGCAPERVHIHRIGVDVTGISFREPRFNGSLKIAMVGRFVEKKGLLDGLRACALAAASGIPVHVTIIGDAVANDPAGVAIRKSLHLQAEVASLAGRVDFTGFVTQAEMCAILSEQNIFITPSRHAASGDAEGGSPVVLAEAMAMGLLCLGSRHCDIPEVIVEGETGLLFDEGDVEGLTDRLREVASGRVPMTAIANQGRRRVEECFSTERQLTRLAVLYRKLHRVAGSALAARPARDGLAA